MKHHKKVMDHLSKAHALMSKMHEAHAGHKVNESKKHRMAEAHGMKKAMHKKGY